MPETVTLPPEITRFRREAAAARIARNELRAWFASGEADPTPEQVEHLAMLEREYALAEKLVRQMLRRSTMPRRVTQDVVDQLNELERRRRELMHFHRMMTSSPAGAAHRGKGSGRHVPVSRGSLL